MGAISSLFNPLKNALRLLVAVSSAAFGVAPFDDDGANQKCYRVPLSSFGANAYYLQFICGYSATVQNTNQTIAFAWPYVAGAPVFVWWSRPAGQASTNQLVSVSEVNYVCVSGANNSNGMWWFSLGVIQVAP